MTDSLDRMEDLMQRTYIDDEGHSVRAASIDFLAPYKAVADGFFQWTCQKCLERHGGRAFGPLTGLVVHCHECATVHLLVATDTDTIAHARALYFSNTERQKELERLQDIERVAESRVSAAVAIETQRYSRKVADWIHAGLEEEQLNEVIRQARIDAQRVKTIEDLDGLEMLIEQAREQLMHRHPLGKAGREGLPDQG